MAENTITAGNQEVIIPGPDSSRVLLELFGGKRGYLSSSKISAGTSGQRIDVGRSTIINSRPGEKHVLYADGADLEYQVTRLGEAEPGRPGVAAPAPGGGVGNPGTNNVFAVNKAYVTGQNPGANTDILSNDITPDEPGTLEVRFVVGGSAVPRLSEDGNVHDLNAGNSMNAGADYSFSINVGSNVGYNFQVDSAVTVNRLRATYSRGLNV